jgi:hypothetical protein
VGQGFCIPLIEIKINAKNDDMVLLNMKSAPLSMICLLLLTCIVSCKRKEDPPAHPTGPCWKTSSNCTNDQCLQISPMRPHFTFYNQVKPILRGSNDLRLYLSMSTAKHDSVPGTSLYVDLFDSRQDVDGDVQPFNSIWCSSLSLGTYYILADMDCTWIQGTGEIGFFDVVDIINPPPPETTHSITITPPGTDDPEIYKAQVQLSLQGNFNPLIDYDDHAAMILLKSANILKGVSNVAYINVNLTPTDKTFNLDLTRPYGVTEQTTYDIWLKLFTHGYHNSAYTETIDMDKTITFNELPDDTMWYIIDDWFEPNGNLSNSWYNKIIDCVDNLNFRRRICDVSKAYNQMKRDFIFDRPPCTDAFNNYSKVDDYGYYFLDINQSDRSIFMRTIVSNLIFDTTSSNVDYIVSLDYVTFSGYISKTENDYPFFVAWHHPVSGYEQSLIFLQTKKVGNHINTDTPWQFITRSAWDNDQEVQWFRGCIAHELGHLIDYRLDPDDNQETAQNYEHEHHGDNYDALGAKECIMNNLIHYNVDASNNIYMQDGVHWGLSSNPHFCKDHITRWKHQ